MIKTLKQKIYNLLRWSEKYTKTDMVYLAKGGSWLTLGQIISSLSAFLLAITFANLLPKEIYGTYKYVLSLASLLAIPTLSGMNTAITQAVARGFEGSFLPAVSTKIKWGLFGGGASIITGLYYFINGNTTLTLSFLIVAIFLPFMDPLNSYISFLNGKKLFKLLSESTIINRLVSGIILVLTIIFSKNLFIIIIVYFASETIIRLILFYHTKKKYITNNSKDNRIINYGKKLSLIDIISTVSNQIDKIVIFHYLGAINLAVYIFSIAIPDQIQTLFKSIAKLALPKFSQKTKFEIKNDIFVKIGKLFILMIPVTIIYYFTAPYFYNFLFPDYLESIKYSQIYALILLPVGGIASTIFKSQKAVNQVYTINISSSILRMVLIISLVIPFGIWGVIIAKIITKFYSYIFALIILKKY